MLSIIIGYWLSAHTHLTSVMHQILSMSSISPPDECESRGIGLTRVKKSLRCAVVRFVEIESRRRKYLLLNVTKAKSGGDKCETRS